MFLGKVIANSLFVLVQCVVLYFVGFVIYPLSTNYANPLVIMFILFLAGLFGLTAGLTFSVLSSSKEGAIQFVPFTVLILLMLGDFFFIKFYEIPKAVENLAYITPMSLSYKLLEASIADVYGFTDSLVSGWHGNFLFKLGLWTLVLIVVGLIKFNLERKK